MATLIQLRRDILGADPTTGDLQEGELGYAYASDKLFIGGPSAGSVRQIGGASVIALLTTIPGVATANKTVILDSSAEIDAWSVAGLVEAQTFKTSLPVNAGFVKNDISGNLLFGQTGEQSDLDLDDLADVTLTVPTLGEYLCFDGSVWVNAIIPFNDLSDVVLTSPASGEILSFTGANWVNTPPATLPGVPTVLDNLLDVDTTTVPPSSSDVLTFNGSLWVPLPSPSGGATNLNALTDVTLTAVASGEFLRNDGAGQFVNVLILEADISNLKNYALAVHTHVEADITDLKNYTVVGHTHLEADITDLQNYSLPGHTHLEADITDLQAYLLGITGENLGDLSNVSSASPSSGQHLVFNGSVWAPFTFINSQSITDLSDVQNAPPSDKDFMRFSSGFGEFVFGSAATFDLVTLTDLQTLTNKTLTNPNIDQISSTGTLTVSGNLVIGVGTFSGDTMTLTNNLSAAAVTTTGDVTAFDFKSTNPTATTPGFVKNSGFGVLLYGQAAGLDLDDLQGVNVPSPSNNQLLTFVSGSGNWEAVSLAQVMALNDLSDVDTSGKNVGDHLEWDGANWAPAVATDPLELNDLTDVTLIGLGSGDFLRYNGAAFVNTILVFADLPSIELGDLNDVSVAAPSTNEVLTFTGSQWEAVVPSAGAIGSLTDVIIVSPATGQVLEFDGSDWKNTATPRLDAVDSSDTKPIVEFFTGHISVNHSHLTITTGDATGGPVVSSASVFTTNVDLQFHTQGTGGFRFLLGGSNPAAGFVKNDAQGKLLFGQPSAIPFDDLLNVFVPSPDDLDALVFVNANNRWEAMPIPGFSILDLDDLGDVTITAAASGDFLRYNGTAWVDATISDVDVPDSLTMTSLLGTTSGATVLTLADVASAVNSVSIGNSIASSPLEIKAIGTDTDIDLTLHAKGTGAIRVASGFDFFVDGGVAKFADDVVITTTTKAFYFGDPATDGTWRLIRDIGGTEDLLVQERVSSSWVTKASFAS